MFDKISEKNAVIRHILIQIGISTLVSVQLKVIDDTFALCKLFPKQLHFKGNHTNLYNKTKEDFSP